MDVSVQLATAAGVPLNVTVPAVAPKFVPAIVTGVPTAPAFGDKLPMFGAVPGGVEWELPELTPAQPHMKSKRRTVTNITRKEWPDVSCLIMGELFLQRTVYFGFRTTWTVSWDEIGYGRSQTAYVSPGFW